MATETPEHHFVWGRSVTNSPRIGGGYFYSGHYSQVQVGCACGYREVVIGELLVSYATAHLRRVGAKPQAHITLDQVIAE